MPRFSSSALALAALCAAAASANAAQGVLIAQTTTVNGTPRMSQVQIESTRMRTEVSGPDGSTQVVVFDGAKQVLYVINPAAKSYSEMTKADVDAAGAQLSGAMAQMQKMLESMPPAQRAQMEAMMKGRGLPGVGTAAAAKPEYRRNGTSKVSKWTCEVYDAYENGQKTGEVCTVPPASLGFTPADFEVSRQLAAFMRGLIPQGADQLLQVGRVEEQGFNGVPVRRVMTIAGRQLITELNDVSRQTFPDAVFALPEGFTKTESPLGALGRGRGAAGTGRAGAPGAVGK